MHAANRAAWDEAAERYEGWFDEAVALIRSGGTNLFGVEIELIGDLHGRCRRAIHLQCAGGRDTLSLWNLGADEVVGVDFSPRMLDLADAPDRGDRRAGALDPGRRPRHAARARRDGGPRLHRAAARSSGSRTSTPGPRSSPGSSRPSGRFVLFEGHPAEWLFDADEDGRWIATDYDYFAGTEASQGWAPEYIDRLSIAERRAELEVRPGVDAGRGRHGPARRRPAARGGRRAPGRLVGRPRATSAPRSAAASRCRSRSSGGAPERSHRLAARARAASQAGCSPANRPSAARSTRATSRTAAGAIAP